MTFWLRFAHFCNMRLAQFAITLLVALSAATAVQTISARAATPPLTLQDLPAALLPHSVPLPPTEPAWLAIDNDISGYMITLAGKWREAADSPEHELEVLRTTGWYFSRLFDCAAKDCGSYVRAILSGGVLQANVNIQNFNTLIDQMPRREITRLVASIAGLAYVDPDELEPIKRAGAFGYRVRIIRPQPQGNPIALVIDCLYKGNRFLILTAATAMEAQEIGALSLDLIAQGITAKSADTASSLKRSGTKQRR